jgi:siroheme synthase (precorrin-2 oxidase/ferrochelatase)
MAIERQNPIPEQPQTVEEREIMEQIDIGTPEGQEGFVMMEDGSAVLADDLEEPIESSFDDNLADMIDESELNQIANDLIAGVEKDKSSRQDWEKTYTDGLKYLGMKFDEDRSEPFEGASGVIHPLLGEAVTTFQAQAYKELLPAGGPVKTQVIGNYDSNVELQAQRVKEFMNYQIVHNMEEYDQELDQLLFYLPLAGSAFKKIYYDSALGRAVSKFVAPEDLIVPYYTTDLESCPRITNVVKMSENEVKKLQATGFYRRVQIDTGNEEQYGQVQEEIEKLSGMEPSYDDGEVAVLYEIHANLDIPGFEDVGSDGEPTGIKLPYIVTIDAGSNEVLSIRRNYNEDDPMKNKVEYFVHFKFLPGLGFYGFGLTHMIGGLSKASTSIMRQLIDAGTLANLPAGFKTRGIRIRDEDTPLQPGEFRDVDAPGGSLRESIQPLPFKEPSGTLLNLLGILVDSGKTFASIAEINTGQGNPQAPVGTTMALLERSTKVLSAIHKRLHNAQRKEFKILSKVFQEYLPNQYPYMTPQGNQEVGVSDFNDRVDIIPVSNPDIFSTSQRIAMAQEMMSLVGSNPEIHGPDGIYEAYRRMYSAIGIDNPDNLLKPPPSREPKPIEAGMENNSLLLGQQAQAFPEQNHDAHIAVHMSLLKTPPVQSNAAIQAMIHSHIMQHLQMKADGLALEQMPPELRQQYEQMSAQMQQMPVGEKEQMQLQMQQLVSQFSAPILAELVNEFAQKVVPKDEDPLVTIRKQELALKGQELAQENQQFIADQQRRRDEAQREDQIDAQRILVQKDIADEKADITRERMAMQQDKQEKDMQLKIQDLIQKYQK